MRDLICITICIFCLAAMFAMAMRPESGKNHVASPATTKLLKKHGVGGCEYKGNVCTFERDGKTIKIHH